MDPFVLSDEIYEAPRAKLAQAYVQIYTST